VGEYGQRYIQLSSLLLYSKVYSMIVLTVHLLTGGSSSHFARNPVPLQSTHLAKPWNQRNTVYSHASTYEIKNCTGRSWKLKAQNKLELHYLPRANHTSCIFRGYFAQHIVAKNKEACACTPLALHITSGLTRWTRTRSWLLYINTSWMWWDYNSTNK
jgi:hypothetical protein